jgi:hypothetical protein
MVLNQPFARSDENVEVKFKAFKDNDIFCTGDRAFFRTHIERDADMKDLVNLYRQKYEPEEDKLPLANGNRQELTYFCMKIDRETGYIKSVYEARSIIKELVGGRNAMTFNNLPGVLRLQRLSGSEE